MCRVVIDAKDEPGLFHLTTMLQLLSKHELIAIFTYGTVCLYCFHIFHVHHISKNSSEVSCSPKDFGENISILMRTGTYIICLEQEQLGKFLFFVIKRHMHHKCI